MFKFALLLTFLGCLPLCHGYSSGPPNTVCTSMQPNHDGNSAQTSAAPYTITTNKPSYKKGESISVTITATNPSTPFRGFFIQARKPGSTEIIGTFSIGADTQIKLITCAPGINNAVSHNSKDDKTSKTFTWMNPGPGGDVVFQATIVNIKANYWMNVQSPMVKGPNGASKTNCGLAMLIFIAASVMFLS